jgi:hypothetical protein
MKIYLVWECIKANSRYGFKKTLVKLFKDEHVALDYTNLLQEEDQWRECEERNIE